MMSLLRLAASGLAVILLTGTAVYARTPLKVHVSILPQKYFVERIAGKLAMVDVLVKPGKSPATYSPTPDQVRSLSAADVYFRIGVPFENGFMYKVESIAHNVKLVDCRQGIQMRNMAAHGHDHGAEDHDEEHDEGNGVHGDHAKTAGKDPHIWMSPLLVKHQAGTILDALRELDPENAAVYNENYNDFVREKILVWEKGQNNRSGSTGKSGYGQLQKFGIQHIIRWAETTGSHCQGIVHPAPDADFGRAYRQCGPRNRRVPFFNSKRTEPRDDHPSGFS